MEWNLNWSGTALLINNVRYVGKCRDINSEELLHTVNTTMPSLIIADS